MTAEPSSAVRQLLQHARRHLLVSSLLQASGRGLFGGACGLLVLALIQQGFTTVSPTILLAAIIVPLLLALTWTLVSSDTSNRRAAAAVDAWLDGKGLMTSAADVITGNTGRQPAGERHTILQAERVAPQWQAAFRQRALPWPTRQLGLSIMLGIIALFLLSLPVPVSTDQGTQTVASTNSFDGEDMAHTARASAPQKKALTKTSAESPVPHQLQPDQALNSSLAEQRLAGKKADSAGKAHGEGEAHGEGNADAEDQRAIDKQPVAADIPIDYVSIEREGDRHIVATSSSKAVPSGETAAISTRSGFGNQRGQSGLPHFQQRFTGSSAVLISRYFSPAEDRL